MIEGEPENATRDASNSNPAPHLTPRQQTVCQLLLRGLPRKEIAAELNLSIATVHTYVKEIYRAHGVHSHPQLMRRYAGPGRSP